MRILSSEAVKQIGQEVELYGWVETRRDHGKIIFIDLRDRKGVVQLVFSAKDEELRKQADKLRPEWVIRVEGTVAKRPADMINPDLETGELEVQVSELQVLAEAETPPFPLDTDGYEIDEDLRLKYRYLDLRRPRLQKNMKLRSEFVRLIREFLFKKNFVEIETPILTKATPEGARDFIVPSRLQPGKFFALPQSPQQYKQLLMLAGFERYFQIAKAIRDEDLRADRGFEHSQIDLEMSFVKREDVMALAEEMITSVTEALGYRIKEKPFPIFTYKEAM
ncbi:MAG: amino acid--tRNA ligase-related protein, partial [Candidatus Colwellbacteria bacterium]